MKTNTSIKWLPNLFQPSTNLGETQSSAYQIVQEEEIEHKNEYYELHLINNSQQQRIFFSTNQENLEQTARQIIDDMGIQVEKWHIIPHLKH